MYKSGPFRQGSRAEIYTQITYYTHKRFCNITVVWVGGCLVGCSVHYHDANIKVPPPPPNLSQWYVNWHRQQQMSLNTGQLERVTMSCLPIGCEGHKGMSL